jgi:hypothetical protein
MSTDLHLVTLTANAIDTQVYAILGPTNPVLANGYGGWSVVNRPQRKALTNWEGHQPFQMELDLYFSDFKNDDSVEKQIVHLERMALVDTDLNPNRPPVIRIHGDAIPKIAKNLAWVIQDIKWGETKRSENHGFRTRQQVLVSLLEHIDGGLVDERKTKPGSGHKPKYRTYTVKKGDTLQGIAKKLLGKASRWQEIAKINNIHDPRNLKVGKKLRVPRK